MDCLLDATPGLEELAFFLLRYRSCIAVTGFGHHGLQAIEGEVAELLLHATKLGNDVGGARNPLVHRASHILVLQGLSDQDRRMFDA